MEPAGRRDSLRRTAQAVPDAWDKLTGSDCEIMDALVGPITGLRAALATKASSGSASADTPCAPKGPKQATVLTMLRRDEGASGPQIAEAGDNAAGG